MSEFTAGSELQRAMLRHRMDAEDAFGEEALEPDEGIIEGLPYFEQADAEALIGQRYQVRDSEPWLAEFGEGVVSQAMQVGQEWKVKLQNAADLVHWATKQDLKEMFEDITPSAKAIDAVGAKAAPLISTAIAR